MIGKIQRPVFTLPGKEPSALVYNEDQSFYALMPFYQCEALFLPPFAPKGTLKVYHKAKLVGTELHIGERVAEPDW